ncbi:MAG: phosphatase PAP2-related protein [Candidatus Pacebacteria bacterium]|nr:phosphatase PAP2-related protein [Candidatus Paceibacterota bacterium]
MSTELPLYFEKSPRRALWTRYRGYFSQRAFRSELYTSMLYFAASVVVSFYAINYANQVASNYVTDIVLSNIPAFDVDGLFGYGTILLIAFIALLLLSHPRRMPFSLYAMGTFFLIRSVFTSLTHLGPFPTLPPNGDWGTLMSHFLFGSDYFFSGHVGVCFLMALVFWEDKILRYAFLAWSLYMALVVLAGHYHYSIDVASAYFITYTIFSMSVYFFPKALAIFSTDPVPLP